VAQPSQVQLRVFDVTGAQVCTLVDRRLEAGRYPMIWDGRDDRGARVSSGVYYVQFQAGSESTVQKVVRIR
jgi:flagellar hook assembly protein FlgD